MYRNRRKSILTHTHTYFVQFHLFQKICLQCQTRWCVHSHCCECVCCVWWMLMSMCIWLCIRMDVGYGSFKKELHTVCEFVCVCLCFYIYAHFKWEMTNAKETAQIAIKYIIYLNCQAFFIRVFFVHKVTSTRGPNRIFVNYFVWFRSKSKRVGAHQSTIRSQQNSVCK